MFHCVQQTEADGGANLWVDAFHVANLLYEENPEAFQILATTPVAFRNFTKTLVGPMYNQSRHTLIRLVFFCVILNVCEPRCTALFCLCSQPKIRACEHTEG